MRDSRYWERHWRTENPLGPNVGRAAYVVLLGRDFKFYSIRATLQQALTQATDHFTFAVDVPPTVQELVYTLKGFQASGRFWTLSGPVTNNPPKHC